MRPSNILSVLVVFCGVFPQCFGEILGRCYISYILLQSGFPKSDLGNWICLIESESARNTSAIGGPNKNKSYDYGLFQINDRYWCDHGKRGGDCHMKCGDLIDSNILDDIDCVKIIFKRHNFSAWNGWKKRCNGTELPDLSECFPCD